MLRLRAATRLPQLRASDVLAGRFDARKLRGKTVLVGTASDDIGDQFQIPGRGRKGGVYIQALAAETLKRGRPVSLGWLPALLLAL
ncbi:MAG: CHASE2 domain-containing protein, partial [Polaromonas sp.]|nr:CHASE2 domain-containing protein [Gemmatimonadaceae bacterium]